MASLVAMILIAVSCAASACSVKCGLHNVMPSCHAGVHRQGDTMPGMGAAVSLSTEAQVSLPHVMGVSCEKHVCLERDVLETSESATALHLSFIQQAIVVTLINWPAAKSLPKWLPDPPTFRENSLVSLHTVLRV